MGSLRTGLRRRVASARVGDGARLAVVGALLGGAAVMAQAAADARFLATLGISALGVALAASSAALAVVLALVGGLSDRGGRRRALVALCVVAAALLGAFAALAASSPRWGAWLGFLGAKQLTAAVELAFWMVATERLDARQSVRAVPRLAAIGGVGGAASALLAVPLAGVGGAAAVMLGGAGLLLLAALAATALPKLQRVTAAPPAAAPALLRRALRDGWSCVVASPLARQLAALVALGGAFAALVYVSLAAAAAGAHPGEERLAALLSTVRGLAQLATVAAQLAVAPWLLRTLGTGWALCLTPAGAVVAALALARWPSLAAIALVSVLARALDQSLDTPAQRLLHTLLPPASRGRVVGFVEGVAKRSGGAIAGLVGALWVSAPVAFAIALTAAAAAWLAAAARTARRLPTLAVAAAPSPPALSLTRGGALGPRALAGLRRELGDVATAPRAAELLAHLAGEGQAAACALLLQEATARRTAALLSPALAALARTPPRRIGAAAPAALAAALDELDDDALPLALGALALTGGHAAAARWREDPRPEVALAADVAALATTGPAPALERVGDELRHGEPAGRALAARFAALFALRALALRDATLALAASWHLLTVARRDPGAARPGERALPLLGQVLELVGESRSAELALLRAEALIIARRSAERGAAEPARAAEGLGLLGPLLARGEPAPEELALVVQAIAARDEEVADAATTAARRLGVAATAELVVLAGYGRRATRDRAAALLRELPATADALEQLVARELASLEQTCLALGAVDGAPATAAALPPPIAALLARRLDERSHEIAHTVLLLTAAGQRAPALVAAAGQWRLARGRYERARALAVLDTALPRALATRLLPAIDEAPPRRRAHAVASRLGRALPSVPDVVRAELAGSDGLARHILLHGLPPTELRAHRDALAEAARRVAGVADPQRLLRRLAEERPEPEGAEMPSHVETLLALSKVPLLAGLSTRQLEELARRGRWRSFGAGQVAAHAGDALDALYLVAEGELCCGEQRFGAGQVVDELAWVAPRSLPHDLRADTAGRLLTLERAAFEELADDVPGLGAALCRALAARLREASPR